MVLRRVPGLNHRGFTLAEVLVVVAVVGVLAVVSIPMLLTYLQAATLNAAAEELVTGINQGRQLAIAQNQNVCVEIVGNQYRYRVGGCAGAVWTGLGTGPNGFFRLANNVTFTTNANPVFTFLGAAQPGATFTVTHGGHSLNVVVAASGRVQIQ